MDLYVKNLLTEWGLDRLHEIFEENEIDKEALFLLGEEDVKAWIPKTGPRLKFLKRLANLKASFLFIGDDQPSLNKILEEYPRFKDPNGHFWIEDFRKLHEGSQRLTSMWERISKHVVNRVALDVKDPAIKRILTLVDKEPELSQDAFGATSLYLMPSLFTPGSIATKKGSQKRWKPTITESMRAFIATLSVGADLEKFKEDRHAECRKHTVTWQPQVAATGSSVVDIQQVFVFLNDIIYSVPSVVKA